MPLPKLDLAPEAAKFQFTAGSAVVTGAVAGGLNRRRLDQQGAPVAASVEWLCSVPELAYLGAFYRSAINHGSMPFLIDLPIGSAVPVECQANFLPGSFQLAGISGLGHNCVAQLEVVAPARDAGADAALVAGRAAVIDGLPVMALTPSMNGYAVHRGATAIRTQPGLGPSAFRLDRFNTVSVVSLGWNVGRADHDYLMAFYFTAIAEGALPFWIEVVHDHPDNRLLKATIQPGSFGLQSINGLTYGVQASVEVEPITSPDYDTSVLELYGDMGEDWLDGLDRLDRLVNVDMPLWD